MALWSRTRHKANSREEPAPPPKAPDGWRRCRPLSWLTFETYVVGSSNRAPFEAATEVARRPGKRCNPLFLYGDVGLGKTHLMNAIGNQVTAAGEDMVVVYMPSVRFAEEMLQAIERNELSDFRERCVGVDVLLLEDVQFLARQRPVQEEFADLFTLLCREEKQVVVTSDRPPHAVEALSDRVRSAFSAGVITGVDYPTLEMRAAILSRQASQKGLELPDKYVIKIARQCGKDIRRVEGVVNHLAALVRSGEVTRDAALEQVLRSLPRESETSEEGRDA
jgi:chromosomal replication initiator protein